MTEDGSDWVEVSLDDIGRWHGGSTPSKSNSSYWRNGTIPWISPKDFTSLEIGSSQDHLTEHAVAENGISLIPPHSLLFVVRSGILKHSLPVAINTIPAAINQDVKALELGPGINSRFIQFQLYALATDILYSTSKSGTTVESLEFAALRKVEVAVAPPDTQASVVHRLQGVISCVGRLRAALESSLQRIENLKSSLLQSAYSGQLTSAWRANSETAQNWDRVTLREIAQKISYGSAAKSKPRGMVAVLRMGNIQDGLLDLSDLVFTSDKNEIKRFALQDGDVLFNRTNSPELVGKTTTYRSEIPAIAAGYLIVVRCNERILPELLTYFLNSPAGRAYCWRVKSDGVSQSNINAQKLASFEFDLPSLEEQAEIVRRLDVSLRALRLISAAAVRMLGRIASLERAALLQIFRSERSGSANRISETNRVLAEALEFKMASPKRRATTRKTAYRKMSTVELLAQDLKEWPSNGLTFGELEARVPREYEDLKEALFSLMTGHEPIIHQEFIPKRRLMVLKRISR